MTDIAAALAPIFALIMMGYLFRRAGVVPEPFWAPAERVTYYVFFPSLLVTSAATADLEGLEVAPMAAALACAILAAAAVLLAARRRLGADGAAFTSVLQGAIRPNVYVAFAAAAALFGEAGRSLTAVAIVVAVPLVNVVSVAALARYAAPAGTAGGLGTIVGSVIRNPLILACALGGALNAGGIALPPVIGPLLEILGRAALPLALLAVGAGLDFAAVRAHGARVAVASAVKLAVLPALAYLACLAFGVGGLAASVTVMFASVPVSASAYVLARQMGGHTSLLAGIITATTLAAAVTMPAILIALGA